MERKDDSIREREGRAKAECIEQKRRQEEKWGMVSGWQNLST